LIEVLVVIAIVGILAAVLTGSILNARKRTVDAAAESYARQVATWVAAADAGGADVTGVSECTDELLRQEGASAVFPNGVAGCSISYAGGHWTVAVNSQSGRVFQVSY
jgi:type IV pilus assembly protein PilA